MGDTKIKRYTVLSILFGAVSLLCLLAFVIVLLVADGNILAKKPTWLGFLLLMLFGVCLMMSCIFVYLILRARYNEATTVICPKCGAHCFTDDAFCASCGERLLPNEE